MSKHERVPLIPVEHTRAAKLLPGWEPVDLVKARDGFVLRVARATSATGQVWRWSSFQIERTLIPISPRVCARGYMPSRELALQAAEDATDGLVKARGPRKKDPCEKSTRSRAPKR
jgi:hypothetical protein